MNVLNAVMRKNNANLAMHGSDINSMITTGHSFWIIGQKIEILDKAMIVCYSSILPYKDDFIFSLNNSQACGPVQ